jgi:hypothetical protein
MTADVGTAARVAHSPREFELPHTTVVAGASGRLHRAGGALGSIRGPVSHASVTCSSVSPGRR